MSSNLITVKKSHQFRHYKSEDGERYAISLYNDEVATADRLKEIIRLVSYTFPEMGGEKLAILVQSMIENQFTYKRATDAVKFVRDNFRYKNPNIADFINFDKTIKLYTYSEVCRCVTQYHAKFGEFTIYGRMENGDCLWYKKSDVLKIRE